MKNSFAQLVYNTTLWKQKLYIIVICNSNYALVCRHVERAFLLKDSEIHRKLMKEINNDAEKEKRVKKKKGGVEREEQVEECPESGERCKD